MNTPKRISTLILFLVISMSACDSDDPASTIIDIADYRVAQASADRNTGTSTTSDNTLYSYDGNGELNERIITYSNSLYTYTTNYTNLGSTIEAETKRDETVSLEGTYYLLPSGKIDSTYFWDKLTNTFNSSAKYEYNSNQKQARNKNRYDDYRTDIKKFYSDGNYSYWIYERYDDGNPDLTRKDSIVFEYYTDIPLLVPYAFTLGNRFGELNNNLVKTRTFYDLLNNGEMTQTYNYVYTTNDIGLVTKQMWERVEDGNVESSTSISYTYTTVD